MNHLVVKNTPPKYLPLSGIVNGLLQVSLHGDKNCVCVGGKGGGGGGHIDGVK